MWRERESGRDGQVGMRGGFFRDVADKSDGGSFVWLGAVCLGWSTEVFVCAAFGREMGR